MSSVNQSEHLFKQYGHIPTLDQSGKTIAEYCWIDGSGITIRSKARTIDKKIETLEDAPEWNYDGSSCYQASTQNSEVILKPVRIYRDPFRQQGNVIVMCDAWVWGDQEFKTLVPANTNFRSAAKEIFDRFEDEKPWYGIEQEYSLLKTKNKFVLQPLGWPSSGFPSEQGPYYCSVGANICFGRAIMDAHYKSCLYAGVQISGTNAEVMPGQWEFQVGPCEGIKIGDDLHIARYLLQRVAEDFNVSVSFEPKLYTNWNGSGCHTNFSTETMRAGHKGMKYIEDMMEKFRARHALHIEFYGSDNDKRLTGIHETSSISTFSYGPGNRACSFRIPTTTFAAQGKGYVEDRRPASNIDPYVVSSLMIDTAASTEETSLAAPLVSHVREWKEWVKNEVIDL